MLWQLANPFRLREIFSDDRLPLAQGELYRVWPGGQGFRWRRKPPLRRTPWADVRGALFVGFQGARRDRRHTETA